MSTLNAKMADAILALVLAEVEERVEAATLADSSTIDEDELSTSVSMTTSTPNDIQTISFALSSFSLQNPIPTNPFQTFRIVNPQSGKVLDVAIGATGNGPPIQLWDMSENKSSQKWFFTANGAIVHADSRKALSVCSQNDASMVHLRDLDAEERQKKADHHHQAWHVQKDGTIVHAQTNKVLTIEGDMKSGSPIQVYERNGTGAQKWIFVPATISFPVAVPFDRNFWIFNPETSNVLDLDTRDGTSNGTRIRMFSINGTASQIWRFMEDGGIVNPQSGRALDIMHQITPIRTRIGDKYTAGKTTQATCHLWDRHTSGSGAAKSSQQWIVLSDGSIVQALSGLALEFDGFELQLLEPNGTKAQKWILVPV